jgi:ubiquinone/menaquinone biosynthesis C-methylase UbiE
MTTLGRTGCASALRPAGMWELKQLGGPTRFGGKRLLDIGTGDGRLAIAAAALARTVVGIDPDHEAIRRARTEVRSQRLQNVSFRVRGAQHLGLGRERFDVAVFTWSL